MNRRLSLALVANGSALWLLRPDVPQCRELAGPGIRTAIDRDGADAALATAAGAVLWLVLVWMMIALAALAASTVPGDLGAWAERLSHALAPAATRRMLAIAVGVGIAAGPALGTAVADTEPPGGTSAPGWPISAPQWPTSSSPIADPPQPSAPQPQTTEPQMTEPQTTEPQTTNSSSPFSAPPVTSPAPRSGEVVVTAGDTLWSIAAQQLERSAEATAADAADIEAAHIDAADIAASWPQWYRANVDTIGDDPNHIVAGQVLRAPDSP